MCEKRDTKTFIRKLKIGLHSVLKMKKFQKLFVKVKVLRGYFNFMTLKFFKSISLFRRLSMGVFFREHFVGLFVCVAFRMDKIKEEMDIKDEPIDESYDYDSFSQFTSGHMYPSFTIEKKDPWSTIEEHDLSSAQDSTFSTYSSTFSTYPSTFSTYPSTFDTSLSKNELEYT